MANPFLGELKIISWNFAPKGWALSNGQQLPINQNQALFSLFGTMYGGNGQTTFALPDMRGRAPVHVGAGFTQGQAGGQESHTLTLSEMPAHTHFINANSTDGDDNTPTNHLLAREVGSVYRNPAAGNLIALNPAIISNVGGSQPHTNVQPYLVLNYVVALIGIFPSRN